MPPPADRKSSPTAAAHEPETPLRRARAVFAALLLVMLLASLDQTIVSTALPTIVGDLGGLAHLSWVVTAYLLATTVVGPLYGKLGDLYGRKILLQAAIVLFLAGSALCGLARGMTALIAFRALQGLGGGGLMVTAMAVVGDIIPPRDRGRYQGIFGAVFGVSTVIGPLLGGFFVDRLSWRWIFYVNLPIGLVALLVIAAAFRAEPEPGDHRIDYPGAALLAGALSCLVLLTSIGGTAYAWTSAPILVLAAVAGMFAVGFVAAEARASEPILPLSLFNNRIFAASSAIGLVVGLALFGSVTYLPLYLQIVKGESPSASGLQLMPMMGGVLVTSIASGQLISRLGRYKPFPIAGTAIMTAALYLLSRLSLETSVWTASAFMLVLGLGLGMVMQVLVLAVQNAVEYRDLGVATAGATLFRSIGGAVGVALFGAIFAGGFHSALMESLPPGTPLPSTVSPAVLSRVPPQVHEAYRESVATSLGPVFLVAAAIAALAFLLSWLLREVPLRRSVGAEGLGESFALPREASSLRELERMLSVLARRENRWRVYQRLAGRAGLSLAPPAIWLLARLGERPLITVTALMSNYRIAPERLDLSLQQLREERLIENEADDRIVLTEAGVCAVERLVAARRASLAELLAGWTPEQHEEVRRLLDRLSRTLVTEMPAAEPVE